MTIDEVRTDAGLRGVDAARIGLSAAMGHACDELEGSRAAGKAGGRYAQAGQPLGTLLSDVEHWLGQVASRERWRSGVIAAAEAGWRAQVLSEFDHLRSADTLTGLATLSATTGVVGAFYEHRRDLGLTPEETCRLLVIDLATMRRRPGPVSALSTVGQFRMARRAADRVFNVTYLPTQLSSVRVGVVVVSRGSRDERVAMLTGLLPAMPGLEGVVPQIWLEPMPAETADAAALFASVVSRQPPRRSA